MNENKDAEIVATCEAAVTRLTEKGWIQGGYAAGYEYVGGWNEPPAEIDYTDAKACLGGALALASRESLVGPYIGFGTDMRTCPAVPAVAAVTREKYPDLHVQVGGYFLSDEEVIFALNDTIAKTPEDVIEVLNETIKRHTSEVVEP